MSDQPLPSEVSDQPPTCEVLGCELTWAKACPLHYWFMRWQGADQTAREAHRGCIARNKKIDRAVIDEREAVVKYMRGRMTAQLLDVAMEIEDGEHRK